MKRFYQFALALVALAALCLPARAQFWNIDGVNWIASGIQSNYHDYAAGTGSMTNWVAIRSPNGPVVIDSAYVTSGSPPYTLRLHRTIGTATVLATNLASVTNLIVDATNSAWAGKWALLYHPSNDLWIKLKVSSVMGITNNVPWGRKGLWVNFDSDYLAGTCFTNHIAVPGDKVYILDSQGSFTFHTNLTTLIGLTATVGGINAELPLAIPVGNSAGDQAVMVEFANAVASAGTTSTLTNEIKLLRGRFLKP